MSQENIPAPTVEQRVQVLRELRKLLREASVLHVELEEEEKANEIRETPVWTAQEALNAKLREINEYIRPNGVHGGQNIGLFARYIDDSSYECYGLIAD